VYFISHRLHDCALFALVLKTVRMIVDAGDY